MVPIHDVYNNKYQILNVVTMVTSVTPWLFVKFVCIVKTHDETKCRSRYSLKKTRQPGDY